MKTFLSTTLLAVLVACGNPAAAQSQCAPTEFIEQSATEQGYTIHAVALSTTGMLLTVWVDKSTADYAVVFTLPDDTSISCVVDEGEAFAVIYEPAGELD